MFVTINGGSMTNKLSTPQYAFYSIGLKKPTSGTYSIIVSSGALTFKSSGSKTITMSLSNLLSNVDYDTARENDFTSTIYKNSTLSISGTITYLVVRLS